MRRSAFNLIIPTSCALLAVALVSGLGRANEQRQARARTSPVYRLPDATRDRVLDALPHARAAPTWARAGMPQ